MTTHVILISTYVIFIFCINSVKVLLLFIIVEIGRSWNEKGCNRFRQKVRGMKVGEKGIRVEWEEIERKMNEVIKKVERELCKEEGKKRGWWDIECEEKKKEERRE